MNSSDFRAYGLQFREPAVSTSFRIAAPLALCASLVASAAPAQVVTKIVRAADNPITGEIVEARDQYVAAINTGDVDKIAPLYTEDALVIPSEGVVLRGKAEVAQYFVDGLHQSNAGGSVIITPFAVTTAGNLGSETGSFQETRPMPTGEPVQVNGVYVTIYSRDAQGRWRIAMEVRTCGGSHRLMHW